MTTGPMATWADLAVSDLHGALSDPLLDTMNFLNEVTARYPEAISFAPGRPHEEPFDVGAVTDYLETWATWLSRDRGMTAEQVSRSLFQYGRTNGQIHDLIARTVRNDEGIEATPDSVVVTVGCQEGMLLAVRALIRDPADVLLVASPCYVGVTGVAKLLDVAVEPVPEGPQGLTATEVCAAAQRVRQRGGRPRALYVVPDFANPSGRSMPVAARHDLLAAAGAEDLLILEDNPYGFFVRTSQHRPTLKQLDAERRVIYLGSFAKTCLPGARVGYLIADQRVRTASGEVVLLADELSKIKSMTTVNTSSLSQALIGGMLLRSGCRLREANRDRIRLYRHKLDTLLTALAAAFPADRQDRHQVRWNAPEGGFFLVLSVPFAADNEALRQCAVKHQVLWTPMSYFYPDGGGEHQVRLSCSALSPAEIEQGVRRLASFITEQSLLVR